MTSSGAGAGRVLSGVGAVTSSGAGAGRVLSGTLALAVACLVKGWVAGAGAHSVLFGAGAVTYDLNANASAFLEYLSIFILISLAEFNFLF